MQDLYGIHTIWYDPNIDLEYYLNKFFPKEAEVNKQLKHLGDKIKPLDIYQRQDLLRKITLPNPEILTELAQKVIATDENPIAILCDILKIPKYFHAKDLIMQVEVGLLIEEIRDISSWHISHDRKELSEKILGLINARKPEEKKK